MTTYAADDREVIQRRITEIRDAAVPRCPQQPYRTLHACLRSSSRCTAECPFHNDWIGPQP